MAKRVKRNRKKVATVATAESAIEKAFPSHKLVDLFLSEASVSRPGVRANHPPTDIRLNVDIAVGTSTASPDQIAVQITLSAHGFYDPKNNPAVNIKATFLVIYAMPIDASELDQEECNHFGRFQGLFHVWPYWREFVQSATSRMGLPPLKMPLIVPAKLKFSKND